MDKRIHVPTPNETEEKRIETEIEEIEKSFFSILLQSVLDHLVDYLLYTALIGLGAWLAFLYIRTYAAEKEEEEQHG